MSGNKTCTNCQAENDSSAKFCFNCGSELASQTMPKGACQSCGFENPDDAKFCASCGASLSGGITTAKPSPKQPAKQKKKPKSKTSNFVKQKPRKITKSKRFRDPFTIGLLIVGVIIVIVFYTNYVKRGIELTDPYVEQKTNNVELENKVLAVASKFICACGSCPKEPLETCSCPTARKERDFIRNALYSGMDEDNVITTLNNRYGGIESDYESQYGSGKVNLSLPQSTGQNLLLDPPGDNGDASQLASFANRMEIISLFTCPCGQCTMDELKDCDCDHPRGAKEVKQYIDDKISEGNLTVARIIELVENKYGGKIR